MKTKNGLNDSDKIMIMVALWIAMVALFATALSLSRLPDMVTIFYKPADLDVSYYSKYNDLFIALASLIPTAIIIIIFELKKRGKAQHNFMSILLFCIVLAVCFDGVSIYGIFKQFEAIGSTGNVDVNVVISLLIAFALSLISSLIPTIVHSPSFVAAGSRRSLRMTHFINTVDRCWSVGMYVFWLTGIASSFIPSYYSYIPVIVSLIGYATFIAVKTHLSIAHSLEDVLIDTIDSNTAI